MLVTNAWQVWRNRQVKWVFSQFWKVFLFMVIFIGLFSQVSSIIPVDYIAAILGLIITLYAVTTLYKPIFILKQEHDSMAQVITGTSAGVMGGLAGVWAPPIVIYLSARGISKNQFVATAGVLLLGGSIILFGGYLRAGIIGPSVAFISCVLLVPSMVGMVLGEQLRHRLSSKRFERLLLWFFLIMGLNLIRRAVL
jgi:uncharacterized membrane protein YfcA